MIIHNVTVSIQLNCEVREISLKYNTDRRFFENYRPEFFNNKNQERDFITDDIIPIITNTTIIDTRRVPKSDPGKIQYDNAPRLKIPRTIAQAHTEPVDPAMRSR